MISKSTEKVVFEHFCTYPTTPIHLRQLARTLNLSLPTIITTINKLAKEGYVEIKSQGPLKLVTATHSQKFIQQKRISNLEQLYDSGLVDAISKTHPEAIICFGSYSRGEDSEQSDIDIAIKGTRKPDLTQFEHKLHRKISVHFVDKHMNKELIENLKNGIVLEGTL